jgi:Tfp pilus assembly protein PilF
MSRKVSSKKPARRASKAKPAIEAWNWWLAGAVLVGALAYAKFFRTESTKPLTFQDSQGNPVAPASGKETPTTGQAAGVALNQGTYWMGQGDPTNALASYQEALRLAPEDADAHYNLGLTYARLGDPTQAQEHYRKALELSPAYPEVHNNLGLLLQRQNRLEEAEIEFKEAIRLFPEYAKAHNNLGSFYAQQKRLQEAVACYEKSVELDEGQWDAWFNLGQARRQLGNPQSALEALQQTLRLNPDFEPARGLVRAMENQPAPLLR